MKINENSPIKPNGVGLSNAGAARGRQDAKPATDESKSAAPAAKVELSARSRELHEALQAAREAPDVREAKVAEAKARIKDGQYQVDPDQIARGILDRRA